jgi:5'/3'-nucleotidase SurE
MRILISNDDGIYSPGILPLAKAAARFGDVRIVAPDVEQSSMSHAITSSRPLRFKRIHLGEFEAYSVNGTPADCVALGMHHWGHAELVLSGINLGLNLGNSCWHSGTLAAAKQAALLGSRGIAFSTAVSDSREPDFSALEPYVAKVLDLLMPSKTLSLVNVNLPQKPKAFGGPANLYAITMARLFQIRIRWGARSSGSPSLRCKALPKGPTAGQSSTIGYRLLHCVSILPMKQILLEPWHFRIRQR